MPESPGSRQRGRPTTRATGCLEGDQPWKRRYKPQAGFTLFEVLIALTILALAVVALIQLSSQSLRLVKTSADYQQAAQLANRLAKEREPSEEGVDTGGDGRFQWERRVSVVPLPDEFLPKQTVPGKEPLKLFAVTVAVRWGQNQALELATLYTPTTSPSLPQAAPPGGQPAGGGQQPAGRGTATPIPTPARQPRTP